MLNPYLSPAAVLLLVAAVVAAAPASKRGDAPGPEAHVETGDDYKTAVINKARFEAYLRHRLDKLNDQHKRRMDFFAKESEAFNTFWTKMRDERRLFEIRTTRQTMNMYDSLGSLDPRDHAATITDYERMQSNVVKSFEAQQRQRMGEFFMGREARWKDFAQEQVRERAEFAAAAAADWRSASPAPQGTPARGGKDAQNDLLFEESLDIDDAAPQQKPRTWR